MEKSERVWGESKRWLAVISRWTAVPRRQLFPTELENVWREERRKYSIPWVQHRGRRKNPRETGGSGKGTGSKCILHTPECFPQRQMLTKKSAWPIRKCRGRLVYGICGMTALNTVQKEERKVAFLLSRCHKDASRFFSTTKCMAFNPPRGFRAWHMFPQGFTVQTLRRGRGWPHGNRLRKFLITQPYTCRRPCAVIWP